MSPFNIVSEAELEGLRGLRNQNMPHTCSLESKVYTPDDGGGGQDVWTAYATNIPCSLTPLSGTDFPRGAALTPETNFQLALPYGQAVTADDRAVVSGDTNGVPWTMTIGLTFIASPKSFQIETLCFGTDKAEERQP